MIGFRLCIFVRKTRHDDIFFSAQDVRWLIMLSCPIIGDVNFCHLGKIVSARLSTLRLMNNYFVLSNECVFCIY